MVVLLVMRILFAVCVIVKSYLHNYIADKNNNPLGGAFSIEVLWYYTKPVSPEFEKKKKICNYIQTYMILAVLVMIFMGG